MQTYICKCGKTFKKLSKAETTGYVLNDYSPRHECYGCPYIVTERSWQTNEIVKRECRATPKITYLTKCHIGTGKGDFSACKLYSLDLTFVKRVMNYVNSLDGAETGDHLNRIPGEWRAADFGMCYSSYNCFGLAIFNLYFKNNKAGTAARRLVKERFFSESGVRKDMTEEKERKTVLMRIQIAKENARKALERNTGEPTEADIALFEQYEEYFGRSCRFEKVYGFEHKYAKQHRDKANDLYNEIVSKGLEQAYKKWRELKRSGSQQPMCDDCANNDGSCLKPIEGECIRYVSSNEAESYLSAKDNKPAAKTYFDVFLEHYPNFEVSKFDEFVKSVCTAECFNDIDDILGHFTAEKENRGTVCSGKCGDCWKCECKLQWKLTEGTEEYIEPYLKMASKEEDNMARKLQLDAAITKDMKSAALDSFIDNIKMIDVKEIIPSEKNFYEMSAIELLADDIEREGLKHNLVVVKDPSTGFYEVKSGHRRLAAIELLIKEKRIKSTKIPCIVDGEKTEAENELDLIMLNATQRKYSDAELLSEYEHLSKILNKLKDEGKGLNGRIRDNIAKILNISNGQVGKLDNIKHNAAPEVKKAVENGAMSISTANEVAKLATDKQKEVVEKKPDISSAEVKKMQDKKPSAPPKTADIPNKHFEPDEEPDASNDDDFDINDFDDEPEKITSRSFELSVNDATALAVFLEEHSAEEDVGVAAIFSRLNDFIVGK